MPENITVVKLESLKFMAQAYISGELADQLANGCKVDVRWNDIMDGLVLQLTARITSQKLDYFTVEYPRDWWEAFKERWFPAWAKERWPVTWLARTVTSYCLYPMVAMPDQHSTIYIHHAQETRKGDA